MTRAGWPGRSASSITRRVVPDPAQRGWSDQTARRRAAPRSRSRALVSGGTTGDHNSDRVASVQGHTHERLTLSDPESG
jgi:hypothetical protein